MLLTSFPALLPKEPGRAQKCLKEAVLGDTG